MISVDEALGRIFGLLAPIGTETVSLRCAAGRVLRAPVTAMRDQPAAPVSAMDGYAVRTADVGPGASLDVVGEAPAGRPSGQKVGAGQTVRIFTGGVVPDGADRIVIQEDVTRDGNRITLNDVLDPGPYIRALGSDFAKGTTLGAPRRLRPVDIALLAAMNVSEVTVARRPSVALMSTGDELRVPGSALGPGEIPASNALAMASMIEASGADTRLLPLVPDRHEALEKAFDLAKGADLLITIGGASVGDHDLVRDAGHARGMDQAFYKVAMRPGKPLMAGRLDGAAVIGVPGNPVSSLVCTTVFVLPAIAAMQGLKAEPVRRMKQTLSRPLGPNGPREHYMRAKVDGDGVHALTRQDSSLISVLAEANALLVRAPNAPALEAGERVEIIPLTGQD